MEISITRALNQLTLLDKRIHKTITELDYVTYCKKSSNKVQSSQTREEFAIKQRAKYDSLQSLIALRQEIKSKIVLSNAKTTVFIAGHEYTVAEAIERKSSIQYEKALLDAMKSAFTSARFNVSHRNEDVEEKAFEIIKTISSKDAKNIKLEDSEIAQQYLDNNMYELVDPLCIEEKISERDAFIDDFESTVDYALSEANAITKISIDIRGQI